MPDKHKNIREVSRALLLSLGLESPEKDIKELLDRNLRKRLFADKPFCFLKISSSPNIFFPVCNRFGFHSPDMIQLSIKIAEKLQQNDNYDQEELSLIIQRLKRLLNRHSKDNATSSRYAGIKGNSTRCLRKAINKLQHYSEIIKDV